MALPEDAMKLVVELHWNQAARETRKPFDLSPEYEFLMGEFLELRNLATKEASFANKLDHYTLGWGDPCFNSMFQDKELYNFLGLLYTARLFELSEERSSFLKKAQGFSEEELQGIVRHAQLSAASPHLLSTPALISIVERIMETDYFTKARDKHTLKNECLSPVLQYLRQRIVALPGLQASDDDKFKYAKVALKHFVQLENEIVTIYKLIDPGPCRDVSDTECCSEDQAFSLSVEDAERLLAAARRNDFFYDLITKMPPNTAISHEQALLECAEHARLWLLAAKIPVYYNFHRCYSDLAKRKSLSRIERKMWMSDVGYKAKLPSAEEKELRRITLAFYWEHGDEAVGFLVPEDFNNDKNDPDVDVIKFLGRPFLLPPHGKATCMAEFLHDIKTHIGNIEITDLPEKFEALIQMARRRSSKDSKRRRSSSPCTEERPCKKPLPVAHAS